MNKCSKHTLGCLIYNLWLDSNVIHDKTIVLEKNKGPFFLEGVGGIFTFKHCQ